MKSKGDSTFQYSNRKAAYIGEKLRSGGSVIERDVENREVKLEVYIKNEANDVIVPGTATVRFD
ncbi:hypothetical protein [Oceanobacillus senegalensis]|uniref:hypothetical protein n=1 Tax=Oceanobacillus senegalensis TaxID=1936063 RepID=UPI001C4E52F2|nr:hypothetical protein [Oceanobacillus senegalensis]